MLSLPRKHFRVLYADPAWEYRTWSTKGQDRAPQQHYDCMPTDDICALPVRDLAADDSVLFLWVYQPMIPDAFRVATAWGFEVKTVGYFWVKTRTASLKDGVDPFVVGLGKYTRAGAEQCWICKRGRGVPRISRSERQVVFAPLREHSRKPDEIAQSIERLHGDVPRLELFARTPRPGWTVWGNETTKFEGVAA